MTEPLLEVMSKDAGRNAKVRLYPDRIEREKPRSWLAMSSAHQDVEVTPIKSISSVQAKKEGLSTRVTVFATGNTIEFRIYPHVAAHRFKDELLRLVLAQGETPTAGPPPAVAPPALVDRVAQLKDLAELLNSGALSEEEFAAEKARILLTPGPSSPPEAPPAQQPAQPPTAEGSPPPSGSGKIAGRVAAGIATGGLTEASRLLRRQRGSKAEAGAEEAGRPGAVSEPGAAPAGWLPDSSGRHDLRYWDGNQWTEHVSDGGTQGTDSL